MKDSYAPTIIATLQALLYSQSEMDVLVGGWDRVAEVRVCPADYDELLRGLPDFDARGDALDGQAKPAFNIRIVVDKHLTPGRCIRLDHEGNVITIAGHT